MTGKKIDIAVIDSGIWDEGVIRGKVTAKIDFLAVDHKNMEARNKRSSCVHGTTCAKIISSICPQAYFLDLTAMQPDGTTDISKLLEALDWCAQQGVRLIHLSLGTINYFDIIPLKERISHLLDQNVIIVAAYHNQNIRTYPAAFPGVFGVRQDREGILKNGQFFVQEQTGYSYENSIVAHWWGEDGDQYSNSYAAPVITGYAARVLCENKEAGFHTVLEFLKRNAVTGMKYPQKIECVIHKNMNRIDKNSNPAGKAENIEIPVIAGQGCRAEMPMLADEFERKGFQVLLLQEKAADSRAIPIEYYGEADRPLGQILDTVDLIYNPDIIFLDYISGKAYSAEEKQEIDMLISRDHDVYTVTAGGLQRTAQKAEEISSIICRYF